MSLNDFTRLLTGQSTSFIDIEAWTFKRGGRVYTGVVIDSKRYEGTSQPAGNYFRVQCDDLNTRPWVYETDFIAPVTLRLEQAVR